ncbi:tyrosine-type recombinase/integrase [Streptomyces griseoluteus]|uniref:hypothetical protein n=1 Tax=Streptomyces griseoluteus TaxID=29306 RepID=UPI00369FF5D3
MESVALAGANRRDGSLDLRRLALIQAILPKRLAEAWLTHIAADMPRGQYVDPSAGKETFREFATQWLASQTTDPSTIVNMELRFRLHAFPYIGSRSLSAFQPAHIRTWARALADSGMAASYQRTCGRRGP